LIYEWRNSLTHDSVILSGSTYAHTQHMMANKR